MISKKESNRRNVLPPIYCLDCASPTHGGKPYCSEHLDKMNYARELMGKVEEYESDLTNEEIVNPDSEIVSIILTLIKEKGCLSYAKLRQLAKVPGKVFRNYIDYLNVEGWIVIHRGREESYTRDGRRSRGTRTYTNVHATEKLLRR